MVVQTRILYGGAIRAGSETVLHWANNMDPQDAVDATDALIEIVDGAVVTGVTLRADPTVRTLDSATGALTDEVTVTAPPVQPGTASPPQLADQTAMLVRWSTGLVVGRRILRGRSYIPGIAASYSNNGQPSPANVDPIVPLLQAWINGLDSTFVIWSRTAGTTRPVTSASIAPFWASQKRRRDT